MSLLLFTDVSGKALAVTGTPAPTDPWNNGLRYRNSDSALYVQQGFAPAGAPKLGGIARDDQGVMYLALDATPGTSCFNNGGILTDTTGTVYGTVNNPLSGYNGGNPADSAGRILFAPAGFGGDPYAYVNTTHAVNFGSGTSLALPALSLTTGNNIFVHAKWETTATVTSIADTAGNTYTPLTRLAATGPCVSQWFYKLNATGHASNVVAVTWSASTSVIWVSSLQFSGSPATFDVEQATGTTATTSTTVTSGSFSTTAAGLILAGRSVFNSQATSSFNQGITWVDPITNNTNNMGSVGYRITTGALGPITVTETGPGAFHRALCIACFK